jgi:DNA modification methylase
LRRLIANSTAPGDVVLDPFLGSGSTLIACEQIGRRCFGVELDPAYTDVAISRWESFTGRGAVREVKGRG